MYNGQIIKRLMEANRISNKELLAHLGYTKEGANTSLTQLITGNPTVKRLEPVADFFEVSMDIFFERKVQFTSAPYVFGNGNAVGTGNTVMTPAENEDRMTIETLKKLVEEKDKRIETLETLIKVLQKRK